MFIKSNNFYKTFTIAVVLLLLFQLIGYYFFGIQGLWPILLGSYVLNYMLGIALILLVAKVLDSKSTYIGWSFLAFSSLKFLFFFLLLWPEINADGHVSIYEAISFFIPYLSCLFMELGFLAKRLNAL